MHVVGLTALGTLMLHDDAHGCGLGLRIGTQAPDLGGLPFRVRQDERARDPFYTLQGDSTLVLEFLAAALASVQEFSMARFGLRQSSFGPRHTLVDLRGSSANFLVSLLEEFGERQLHMGRDPINFRLTLGLDFFEE